MYILDLDCQCALCGHEQFQRFYHSTDFHSLTLPGLEGLADRAALKAGYKCENCGEAVGANEVRNSVLIYGFADDAGVIRIFDDLVDGRRRFEVTACRRLDPQVVPRWRADEEAFSSDHQVVEDLVEGDVEAFLERPFNPKIAIRDALESWFIDRQKMCSKLGKNHWIVAADDRGEVAELADEIESKSELRAVMLSDGDGEEFSAHWSRWLPDRAVDAIVGGELSVGIYLAPAEAIEAIERSLAVGRLEFERIGDVFSQITTPRGHVYDGELAVPDVLRRAAICGLTAGEVGRLCAEEIVGDLLQIW